MSQLQSSFFKIDRRGAVLHLAMNRPDRSNAMSQDFWADLPRLMRELAGDSTVRRARCGWSTTACCQPQEVPSTVTDAVSGPADAPARHEVSIDGHAVRIELDHERIPAGQAIHATIAMVDPGPGGMDVKVQLLEQTGSMASRRRPKGRISRGWSPS